MGCKESSMETVKTRILKLFDHIAWMADEGLPKLTKFGKVDSEIMRKITEKMD